MKRGNEIGLVVIKTKAKEGTEELKNLHMKVNDILYDNAYRYISPQRAERIYSNLSEIYVRLNELNVSPKAELKKGELISILKDRLDCLQEYMNENAEIVHADIPKIKSTLKYQLSIYLKERESDNFDVEKTLSQNKEIWDDMYIPCQFKEEIDTRFYVQMQEELLMRLKQKYLLTV